MADSSKGFRNTASPIFHDTAPGFAAYRRFIREFETDEDVSLALEQDLSIQYWMASAVPLARWPRAGSTSMAQDGAASRASDQPNGNCAITFSHNTLHEGRIHVPGSHSTLHLQHHQHQRQNQHQHQPRDTPEQKIDVNEVNFSIQSHDDERLPEMK
ncbi:uncharacterized protein N7469_004908 [Penicillium citrinum]|uniref:Uncharacterized protein n=1 Tax=Penicillium citrinum TaxID=5077 RepID=A0A9W9P5X6_PENCI|nr:uncharacterized protein N7469_004908 [Penicillium citrinum]KAJ5235740.1 hypothetical protein N7469_004908 [Penicillium citrinum]